ncbi:hypothetical protein LTR17_011487 [Elasticomyces elasticus]|nr:hypothetical protein LTR17_011487 [Elasticomyces elasticus]
MDNLAEGDFTKSDHWPQVVLGLPDKNDILVVQNKVMAAHMVKEAAKQDAANALNTENFSKLFTLMTGIATKSGMSEEDIAALKPGSRKGTAAKKVTTDKDVITKLDKAFLQRVEQLSADYAGSNYGKLMLQIKTERVVNDNLIGKWANAVKPKLLTMETEIWEGLNEAQLDQLYLVTSKSVSTTMKAVAAAAAAKNTSGAAESDSNKRQRPMPAEGSNVSGSATPTGGSKRKNAGGLPTPGAGLAYGGDSQMDFEVSGYSDQPRYDGANSPIATSRVLPLLHRTHLDIATPYQLTEHQRVVSMALSRGKDILSIVEENENLAADDEELREPFMEEERARSDESDTEDTARFSHGSGNSLKTILRKGTGPYDGHAEAFADLGKYGSRPFDQPLDDDFQGWGRQEAHRHPAQFTERQSRPLPSERTQVFEQRPSRFGQRTSMDQRVTSRGHPRQQAVPNVQIDRSHTQSPREHHTGRQHERTDSDDMRRVHYAERSASSE